MFYFWFPLHIISIIRSTPMYQYSVRQLVNRLHKSNNIPSTVILKWVHIYTTIFFSDSGSVNNTFLWIITTLSMIEQGQHHETNRLNAFNLKTKLLSKYLHVVQSTGTHEENVLLIFSNCVQFESACVESFVFVYKTLLASVSQLWI